MDDGGAVVKTIDLNCDIGEDFGRYTLANQKEILQYVTSCNIACGFHAGDPSVMRETVKIAIENGVKIGAHPGLPDLVGFGRREMAITYQEAYDMVVYQVGALQAFLMIEGEKMQHVKPHGALYNMAAKDPEIAEAIAKAIFDISSDLILFGLASSELTKAGEKLGLRTAHEVFADRTYQQDGTLTSRKQPNAMITDQSEAAQQVIRMVKEGKVKSCQGVDVLLRADTVCIHGDGEHAVEFAKFIKQQLQNHDIEVKAFI